MISVTIEADGDDARGAERRSAVGFARPSWTSFAGLNCATGPEFMTDHVRTLQSLTNRVVSCYPNAGLPNEEGLYQETPTSLAGSSSDSSDRGWLNIVGGCCGTTEQHIRAIAQMADGKKPRQAPERNHRAVYSGIEIIEAEESTRPLHRGRAHQRDWLAPVQESGGCRTVGRSHRDRATAGQERRAHRGRLPAKHRPRGIEGHSAASTSKLIRKIKVPIMIDTTDAKRSSSR